LPVCLNLFHAGRPWIVTFGHCAVYYFTCISFAIRPSGHKSAIKLIETD